MQIICQLSYANIAFQKNLPMCSSHKTRPGTIFVNKISLQSARKIS
jgi:hypothetical protein